MLPLFRDPAPLPIPRDAAAATGLAVAGGVACGKSTAAQFLASALGAEIFDADRCVHSLLDGDPGVAREIAAAFPGAVRGGKILKPVLREKVFFDGGSRLRLEGILHPRVWEACVSAAADAARRRKPLVAEIPLLFEAGWQGRFREILLVASSPRTQRKRLLETRNLTEEIADGILASQLPVREKIAGSTRVAWNDGSKAALLAQLRSLAAAIAGCAAPDAP